jgi:hypothetical protein
VVSILFGKDNLNFGVVQNLGANFQNFGLLAGKMVGCDTNFGHSGLTSEWPNMALGLLTFQPLCECHIFFSWQRSCRLRLAMQQRNCRHARIAAKM